MADAPVAPVALSTEDQARIESLYGRLRTANFYELLEVPRGADKKAIKQAYFQKAQAYHPDRHFKKELGRFRPMIEAIFVRLTEAHDVLTSSRRAEYDGQLSSARTSQIEALVAAAAAEMEGEAEASRHEVVEGSGEHAIRISGFHAAVSAEDEKLRREALARRLGMKKLTRR